MEIGLEQNLVSTNKIKKTYKKESGTIVRKKSDYCPTL
jgi:hypothetical protein